MAGATDITSLYTHSSSRGTAVNRATCHGGEYLQTRSARDKDGGRHSKLSETRTVTGDAAETAASRETAFGHTGQDIHTKTLRCGYLVGRERSRARQFPLLPTQQLHSLAVAQCCPPVAVSKNRQSIHAIDTLERQLTHAFFTRRRAVQSVHVHICPTAMTDRRPTDVTPTAAAQLRHCRTRKLKYLS